jgi:hypothetical protein
MVVEKAAANDMFGSMVSKELNPRGTLQISFIGIEKSPFSR